MTQPVCSVTGVKDWFAEILTPLTETLSTALPQSKHVGLQKTSDDGNMSVTVTSLEGVRSLLFGATSGTAAGWLEKIKEQMLAELKEGELEDPVRLDVTVPLLWDKKAEVTPGPGSVFFTQQMKSGFVSGAIVLAVLCLLAALAGYKKWIITAVILSILALLSLLSLYISGWGKGIDLTRFALSIPEGTVLFTTTLTCDGINSPTFVDPRFVTTGLRVRAAYKGIFEIKLTPDASETQLGDELAKMLQKLSGPIKAALEGEIASETV